MGLLDIFTGGALGAIGGAVSAIGGGILNLKMEAEKRETLKIQNEHELALRDKDLALAAAEGERKFELTQLTTDAAQATAEADLQKASMEADRASYGDSITGRIVDLLRGVTRPLITYAAMVLVVIMTLRVLAEVRDHPLGPDRAMTILLQTLGLASTCVGWWFGARVATRFARGKA